MQLVNNNGVSVASLFGVNHDGLNRYPKLNPVIDSDEFDGRLSIMDEVDVV